jgi:hypothetical protein
MFRCPRIFAATSTCGRVESPALWRRQSSSRIWNGSASNACKSLHASIVFARHQKRRPRASLACTVLTCLPASLTWHRDLKRKPSGLSSRHWSDGCDSQAAACLLAGPAMLGRKFPSCRNEQIMSPGYQRSRRTWTTARYLLRNPLPTSKRPSGCGKLTTPE